jgi:Ca2+-binding RTX toxin-like protein
MGTELQVFTSSHSEAGISQIQADLSQLGVIRLGSGVGAVLEGSALDDVLIAGGLSDQLQGGAGRDSFVFCPEFTRDDGYLERVPDFIPGEDALDLSTLPFLYSLGQVEVESRASGALLRFAGFWLELDTATGPLTEDDFTTSSMPSI